MPGSVGFPGWTWLDLVLVSGLTVNEFVAGSIPVGHLANIFGGKFLWEGSLIVYQVAAGSTPVAIAFESSRIRLLARSAASQAAGRRSKLLCGTRSANELANKNGVVDSDGRIAWFSSRSPRVRFPLTSLRFDRDALRKSPGRMRTLS